MKTAKEKLEQAIKEQNEFYPVYVDGGKHKLDTRIQTKKEQITLKKCKSIVENIQIHFNIKIDKIEILMSEWDFTGITPEDYESIMVYGEGSLPILKNKKAFYYTNENCLRIWENGYPVYENYDGVISRDQDALCDCLM